MNLINKLLPNGVRVLFAPDTRFHTASAALHFPPGAKKERIASAGISHLLEHLLFKRTKDLTSNELAYHIDALGGDLNGYTDFDTLCLHGVTSTEEIGSLVELLIQIAYNSDFNREDLETEVGIIKQEIRESEDDLVDLAYKTQSEQLFTNSRRAIPIFGTVESNTNITFEELIELKDAITSNPIITVFGGFDPTKIEQILLEKIPLLNNTATEKEVFEAKFGDLSIVERTANQLYLVLTLPWIDLTSEDFVGGLILTSILGGSASSRLFMKLREELGLSYEIGCEVEIVAGVKSQLNLFAILDREKLELGISQIISEIKKLPEITETEFNKTVKMLRNQILIDLDDPFSKVKPYLDAILQDRGPIIAEDILKQISNTELNSLKPIFDKYFLSQKWSSTVVGKKIKAKELKELKGLVEKGI